MGSMREVVTMHLATVTLEAPPCGSGLLVRIAFAERWNRGP